MTKRVSILGFAGSLRKASYNRALLSAALELVPEDAALEIFDLNGIPLFNQEMENAPPERESKSSRARSDRLMPFSSLPLSTTTPYREF